MGKATTNAPIRRYHQMCSKRYPPS